MGRFFTARYCIIFLAACFSSEIVGAQEIYSLPPNPKTKAVAPLPSERAAQQRLEDRTEQLQEKLMQQDY